MRLRLGFVVLLVVVAAGGVVSAQEAPMVECPAPYMTGDVSYEGEGGSECLCPEPTGHPVGFVDAAGVLTLFDGAVCPSEPLPPDEPPVVAAEVLVPLPPVPAGGGSVLPRTG